MMPRTERKCVKCGRKLWEGEGEKDGICGDCGLEMMFTGMGAVCIKKEAGEPVTEEMIEQAFSDKKTNDLKNPEHW